MSLRLLRWRIKWQKEEKDEENHMKCEFCGRETYTGLSICDECAIDKGMIPDWYDGEYYDTKNTV